MEYLYPGGLAKAITFSYDDGQVYDRRLIEIFNQAGFKGTFHLNSGNLDKDGYVQKAELPTLYAEHEIACHGVTHRHPRQMNQTEWLREVWQDRLTLEELTGGIVQGMSYAFGEYYPEQVEALCAMGIQYSRTVESTGSFALPQELLRWTDERDRLVAMRSCQITLQVMNGLLFGGAMTALLCYAITRRALFQTVGITLCAVILTLFFVTMAANRYFERRM